MRLIRVAWVALPFLVIALNACTNAPNQNSTMPGQSVSTANAELPRMAQYSDSLFYLDNKTQTAVAKFGDAVAVVPSIETPPSFATVPSSAETGMCAEDRMAKVVVARVDFSGAPQHPSDKGPGFFLGLATVSEEVPEEAARANAYQRGMWNCQAYANQNGDGLCKLNWITVQSTACGFSPYAAVVTMQVGEDVFAGEVAALTLDEPNWVRAWWLAIVACVANGNEEDACKAARRNYYTHY